jgi:hypothetical protein
MSLPVMDSEVFENVGEGPYFRKDKLPPGYATGGILGEIRWLPFRVGMQPFGWWACSGELLALASEAGQVLFNLPAEFKDDWGIVLSNNNTLISMPDLYDDDGYGYFTRGVDGVTRQVGSVQGDATRNLKPSLVTGTGRSPSGVVSNNAEIMPPFFEIVKEPSRSYALTITDGANHISYFGIDISLMGNVVVADEIRPRNIGTIPYMCLGV